MSKSIFLLILLTIAQSNKISDTLNSILDGKWNDFKREFGKEYEAAEETLRKRVFFKNAFKITYHNILAQAGLHSFHLAINEFADLTNREFKRIVNGYRGHRISQDEVFKSNNLIALPDSIDWRESDLVTGVKNQGMCGSCWAFSAVASLEGQHSKASGSLVSLSEQNLVDCSRPEGNMGCSGGLMDDAFKYIILNHGIDTEKSYPYEGHNDRCHYNRSTVGATMRNYTDVAKGDEEALKEAVATVGPISVAIDAGSIFFQFYHHGVYDHAWTCGNKEGNLDHGVTVVGYGIDNKYKKDYWLVKNSWGNRWGESGYIRMRRNRNNQCGIATQASFPVL